MRFVIALALLCCCYASEQTASDLSQKGRLPPQDATDSAGQHKTFVKQQIPSGKHKVEVVKPKMNGQEDGENIKKFIEFHITKVLQDFVKQKKQGRIQVEDDSLSGIPPSVIEKIEALKKEVKHIISQVETHIPQVINKQIDLKNKIKEKHQSVKKGEQLTNQNFIRNISSNEKEIMSQNQQKTTPKLNDKAKVEETSSGLLLAKEISNPIYAKIDPQQIKSHYEDINVNKNKIQDVNQHLSLHITPVSTFNEVIHQNTPQPLHQNFDKTERNNSVKEYITPGFSYVLDILNVNETHTEQEPHQISENFQGLPKQNNPQVVDHYKNQVEASGYTQSVVQQILEHVPQVINQHRDSIGNGRNKKQLLLPEYIKNILIQIHQHIPKVIEDHKKHLKTQALQHFLSQQGEQVTEHVNPKKPSNIEGVVDQIDLQIPQLSNQSEDHIALEQNYFDYNGVSVYPQIIVPQTPHIHPVVQAADVLTKYEIFSNIATSPVQQAQKQNHISPVRTT